ncbi:hypothetical protein MASR2M70_07110 [Bacillota bacterium]
MDNTNYNHSIQCSVSQCAHHAGSDNYCALSQVRIGSDEPNPKDTKSTDCESFKAK